MNTQIGPSRIIKKHWKLSLATFIAGFAVAIAFGFFYFDNIALPLTLIGILPPSVYYFYSEVLDRPLISISDKNSAAITVVPMYAGIEDGPSDFARPTIFYRINIENQGKSTATRARVQVRLSGDNLDREFYARWSGPANPDEYDLLPGQSNDTMVLKVFLTTDFYERLNGLKEKIKKVTDINLDDKLVSPPGNPSGEIKSLDSLESYSFRPIGYTPREQRPERVDRSIQGGWEGNRISITDENIDDEISISARIIADNYRTEWMTNLGKFSFISIIRSVTEDDQYWEKQWQNQGLTEFMNRVRIKMKEWMDNHSEFIS